MITLKMGMWSREEVKLAEQLFKKLCQELDEICTHDCTKCSLIHICQDIDEAHHFIEREIDLNYPHLKNNR